jgi:branched-chain amino acid transport system substrate-binding protein
MRSFIFTLFFASIFISSAHADILLGVAGPMTGQQASFGVQFKRGAEQAIADINAAGGLLGQKVKMELADDACDPKQAVAAANQLVSKKVNAVIGHFCSGSSIPASEVYAEEQIIQITPASTNPLYTERGLSNTFRVCGRDDQQGKVAAEYIKKHYAEKNIAVVHDKSAYGKGLADETKKLLEASKVKVVLFEAVTPGEKDYSALISKLKAAQTDLIYYGGYHQEAGLIVRQAKDQGLNAPLMAGDALATTEFWSITGPVGTGTLMTFNPDPRLNPSAKAVVDKFKLAAFEPEGYTLYTYAAVQAYAAAVTKAASVKFADVTASLRKNQLDTVMGKIGFDAKGDVQAPGYVVYEWKNGKYEYADKSM